MSAEQAIEVGESGEDLGEFFTEADGSAGDHQEPEETGTEEAPEAKAEPAGEPEAEPTQAATTAQPRVEFTPEQQGFIEERIIGPQVARRKAAEEHAQALETELARIREQSPKPETARDPASGEPVIPPEPDPFRADYEQKLQEREAAIREHAVWEVRQEMDRARIQEEQSARAQQLMKETETYLQRGKEIGLTREELVRAGQFIMESGGIHENVAEYIVKREPGPAIMDHLRRNPSELHAIQRMSPTEALAYVVEEIKPKAMKSARRRTAPPPPIETESGTGGAGDDFPKGGVFLD